jgi:hypothetical protein
VKAALSLVGTQGICLPGNKDGPPLGEEQLSTSSCLVLISPGRELLVLPSGSA